MTQLQLGFLILVFAATFGLAIWLMSRTVGSAAEQRVKRVLGQADAAPADGAGARRRPEQWLDRIARATRPLARLSVPEAGFEASALRRRFMHAGIRSASSPMAYFGLKTVLALLLPVIAFAAVTSLGSPLRGTGLLAALLLVSAVGYYFPNYLLAKAIARRQRAVFEAFPDALDLMTICMEAGLGTEAALQKVADDLVHNSPALSEELRLVGLELRAGAPRDRALRNLSIRTGVAEIDGFVSMINQADRFGTSIAQSLRVHSDTVRTRRRQRAEETAAKIPLKLLFPLIFCIFPALMLVIMGPAVIQMMRVILPVMSGTG